MLCCAIAALGLASAWGLHRLRLIGGLMLLVAAIVAGGAVAWDHVAPKRVHPRIAASAPDGPALCSGRRIAR